MKILKEEKDIKSGEKLTPKEFESMIDDEVVCINESVFGGACVDINNGPGANPGIDNCIAIESNGSRYYSIHVDQYTERGSSIYLTHGIFYILHLEEDPIDDRKFNQITSIQLMVATDFDYKKLDIIRSVKDSKYRKLWDSLFGGLYGKAPIPVDVGPGGIKTLKLDKIMLRMEAEQK